VTFLFRSLIPVLRTLCIIRLHSIDLSPLETCTELEEIWLIGNPIQTLDLSPLRNCMKLEEISLPENSLEKILWKQGKFTPEKLPQGLRKQIAKIESYMK